MTTQTRNPTNRTPNPTVESMLASLGSRIRGFLEELRRLDPVLATRALQVRVFNEEDFDPARDGHPHDLDPGSCDWVWFRGIPAYPTFIRGLAAALFGVGHTMAQQLGDLIHHAVKNQDAMLLRSAREVAMASRTWSTQDIEARLGLSLEDAYRSAGVLPGWSETVGMYTRSARTEAASREVIEFLSDCIEGLLHDDDFWTEYTRRLFPGMK